MERVRSGGYRQQIKGENENIKRKIENECNSALFGKKVESGIGRRRRRRVAEVQERETKQRSLSSKVKFKQ